MTPQQLLTEQRDAEEVLDSRGRRRSLSTTSFERLRALLLSDSYLFAKKICRHEDLIPDYHMPLSYAVCGLTDRLIETFDLFDNYVIDQFKNALRTRGIDWRTRAGYAALESALDYLYICWTRGSFKSSITTHASPAFLATRDQNLTIKITHAIDDKAWAFCDQIGKTVKTGLYRDIFPDRIPAEESRDITMKAINLGGRTISHPQKTINAGGYTSKDESGHYDTFITDDLVTEWNTSPPELKQVDRWLRGMSGFFMPMRRIRRIHVGTKHEQGDDHDFLTTKDRATDCLTIKVPIEDHGTKLEHVRDILKRGKPTLPLMFPAAVIPKVQRAVLSDETETDGVLKWCWNHLLIDSLGAGTRLFPPSLVDDPDHWWLGPFEHPKGEMQRKGRFLVARYRRDEEGNPIPKKNAVIFDAQGELVPDWREKTSIVSYDPWTELDRVCLVDPAWASRDEKEEKDRGFKDPDNWAVSAVGTDPELVAFQLETRSDKTGLDGWIEALAEMDDFYHFRVIGFDGAAYQDAVIQNLMVTDIRLRKLRSRMQKVPNNGGSKTARMREGLKHPMALFQFFLRPDSEGNATREELKNIRRLSTDIDGIADSLAMHRAVNRRTRSEEERKKGDQQAAAREAMRRREINPVLGVPTAA